MWVLLPLKDFVKAKQRLSGCLNVAERRGLFQAMVEDVLDELVSIDVIERIVLLSDDPAAHLLATCYGVECWSERELGQGLNPVIEGALDRIAHTAPTISQVMVVHGDLPLINAVELGAMIDAGSHDPDSLIIAADRGEQGSNVVLMPMFARVPVCYGPGSLAAHQQEAAARGVNTVVMRTRWLAMDIDTRDDLTNLVMNYPGEGAERTMKYLRQYGLVQRLMVMRDIQADVAAAAQ